MVKLEPHVRAQVLTTWDRPHVLHLHCPKCGGRVSVQCGPEDSTVGPAKFTCPFCRARHTYDLNARVLWVTEGHEPPATV
jgi:hypothetical protein